MSGQLLEKIKLFKKQCQRIDTDNIVKTLLELNIIIDDDFDKVLKEEECIERLRDQLESVQLSALRLYDTNSNEIHRIRGNIMASTCSLVFVTESKLILLANDDDWCDLDQYYREKSRFFSKDDFFNASLFTEHGITFLDKHPLVQFSMQDCKITLFNLLLSFKIYDSSKALLFPHSLYNAVRNRLAILSNYAYSQDVNDISEYTVRINNNRAIPTSCFLYDFSILSREIERNFLIFERFVDLNNSKNYFEYLEQIKPTYLKWAANMIVTAAGDDFCSLFGKFYCKLHVEHFEILLYKRKYPSVRIIYYKLLQTTRGMEEANRLMQTGNDFVVDLLKREIVDEDDQDELDLEDPDSMCSAETVLERMKKLSGREFDNIIKGIIDYVSERQWNRTIDTFFSRDSDPDVSLEPAFLKVPFSNKIVLFTNKQPPVTFDTFYEAFAGFCYHLQRDYEGVLYDKKTGEKTMCTSLLKKMFAL